MLWLSAIWPMVPICSYILVQLVKFLIWYLIYTLGAIALRILFKLRYEVYNEDLKYKQAECKNRIVIVTGATSGIGLAATNHFYTKGFVVVGCFYSKNEPGYEKLETRTRVADSRYRSMYLVELDVKSSESIENCFKQVKAIMADRPELQLHALVNVAGVGYFHKFQWISRDLIRNTVETNLLGPMMMTRQFLHLLIGNPGSRVVNVSSPMAYIPVEYNSVYGATKAGLAQFTSALEADTLRYGVKTVTIYPGNLIQNTSILNSSMATKLAKIIPELNDDEKRIYKNELDDHRKDFELLETVLNEPDDTKLSHESNSAKALLFVSGSVDGKELHLSESFMQSFDNSIRLKDPRREMFAGNSFFNIVMGSSLELVSRSLLRDAFLILMRNRLVLFHLW